MLKSLMDYHAKLIDSRFWGKITVEFRDGVLQPRVRKDATETLMEDGCKVEF